MPKLLCRCCRNGILRSSNCEIDQVTVESELESSNLWSLSPETLPKIVITCPSVQSHLSDGTFHSGRKASLSSVSCSYIWDDAAYRSAETARIDGMALPSDHRSSSTEPLSCIGTLRSTENNALSLGCSNIAAAAPEALQIDNVQVEDNECLIKIDNSNGLRSHLSSISQNVVYAISIIFVWCATTFVTFIDKLF